MDGATSRLSPSARFGVDKTLETFRSVLYFGGKKPLAGPAAIDAYLARETPGRLIQSLKSFLSSALFRETWVESQRYSVEDLTALLARSLREAAEQRARGARGGERGERGERDSLTRLLG